MIEKGNKRKVEGKKEKKKKKKEKREREDIYRDA